MSPEPADRHPIATGVAWTAAVLFTASLAAVVGFLVAGTAVMGVTIAAVANWATT